MQVWPGATHFPDFLSKAGVKYWADQLQAFHQLAAYDGLWIDMDEASNFCTGDVCHLATLGAVNRYCPATTTLYLTKGYVLNSSWREQIESNAT